MSVRKYEFTVSADSEGVLRRVWGGIQFEDNATEFRFKPDAALLSAAGDGALCRIDINSASGWNPSETLSPNSSGYYCRSIPYSATRFGGEIEIVFVISNEGCEVLSYPVRAYFTEMSRSPRSEEKVYENISGMEQEVKLHADGVSMELKRCEELCGEVSYYHTAVSNMKEDILAAGVSADELKATKNEAEALISEVETKLESGEFKGEKGDKGDAGSMPSFAALFSTEITQAEFDAAGENGIKIVTVGDGSKTFEPYNEILVLLSVPKYEGLNEEAGKLACYLTETEQYSTSGKNELLKTQSTAISTACGINASNTSLFVIRAVFAADTFLYGEVIKNGYGNSTGYAGVTNGWTCVSSSFTKKDKKYVHINGSTFKFPVGTTVRVFGR